jgi:hypothetical protein
VVCRKYHEILYTYKTNKQMLPSIVNFKDTSDYLPILNGVILTDGIVILCLIFGLIQSKVLTGWYRDLSLSAVICDVLIIVLGIILARFLYSYLFSSYKLWKFILLAVAIQCTHDILFYLFCQSVPRGKSRILDIFKNYGAEKGGGAIVADSLMMISSILIASYLKGFSLNANIITCIVLLYLIPYLIYTV